jgi:hypothetical protein
VLKPLARERSSPKICLSVEDPEGAAVPRQDLDPVAAPIPKEKQMARERVEREALAHERRKPIDRTPQVGRARLQVDPDGGRQRQYAARNVVSTVCTSAGDASALICRRSPLRNTTSITGALGGSVTSTGTNAGVPSGAALASSRASLWHQYQNVQVNVVTTREAGLRFAALAPLRDQARHARSRPGLGHA